MILLDNIEHLLGDDESRMRNEDDFDSFIAEVVGKSAIVVAARRGTLGDGWADRNGFSVINLEQSSAGQVLQQVEQWHEAVASECETVEDQEKVAARGRELGMALGQLSALMGLSRNPRICALMCEAFLDSSLSLPRDWIALVEDVLERFAEEDSRLDAPAVSGTARMRDLQCGVARWAIHNEPPFDPGHLADAVQELTAGWGVEGSPSVVVERILSRTTLLRRSLGGLAFVNDEMRDHLAAGDLIASGNINYLRAEARNLSNPRLVVAAAGSARHQRATELVTALLDDAEQYPDASEALVVTAYCCAAAARSLESATRSRLQDAVVAVVLQGDVERLAHPRLAPLALDMLVRIVQDDGLAAAAVAAIEVGSRHGDDALPALRAIAGCGAGNCQEILWESWSRFDVRLFAKTVLSVCTSVPDILVIDSPEKFAAVADLPLVGTVEVVCQVDAAEIRGREDLTVRVADAAMIAAAGDLGPNCTMILVAGGG
ncbi:hypothetical protein F1D05_00265 [Kribbella qitaiheensis]|uniref:Uncharacterized protein n=1 Tax=Kribbella qitaiheensis TaxID=1544730 RepID=A0A7G6WRK4_9ACTN|nr:hypothetical protein [Kribbella qitaiheensis]QNE16619.1 hypothetical protein F1D05_00265 [Kribbella qitaiheensis]